jgi:endo-1,4-beta-xylanase
MRAIWMLLAVAVSHAQWVDPDRTEPAGTKYRTFPSETLRGEVSYLVYLPPDYETNASKRYPAVYWLHGLGGNQRSGAPFVSGLDAAIRAGQAPAMIAVLVNGLPDSRYVDSHDGQRPVEKIILRELVPHVDKTYRTIARRETRAIEGYSMGGFGAARLGFGHPELFGAVSIMAGALLDTDMVTSRAELFTKNFGGSKAYFHERSPWVLVERNAPAIKGRTRIRIGVGELDALYERNLTYHEMLQRLGLTNEFFSVAGVAHEQRKFYEKLGTGAFRFYQQTFAAADLPQPLKQHTR